MKKVFHQHATKDHQPEKSGWYHTDKGKLYWSPLNFDWSCRSDRLSEEYPELWYEEITETKTK